MPSYFCCKCHKLISSDRTVPAEAFVCSGCGAEAGQEKNGSSSKKVGDGQGEDEHLAVCALDDWR